MIRASIQRLLQTLTHTSRRGRSRRPIDHSGAVGFRPRLETLEGRLVPATVRWTNPTGGLWSVAGNWDAGRVPGSSDDVVFDMPAVTLNHASGTDSIHSLRSIGVNATLQISGGALNIATTVQLDNTLSLTGSGSFIGGTISTSTPNGHGIIVLGGGTLAGSTLVNVNVQATANGGTITGGTLGSTLDLGQTDGARVTLSGGPVLNGLVSLGSSTTNAAGSLTLSGNQTVHGNGRILFGNSSANILTVVGGTATFNLPIITGNGQITSSSGAYVIGNTVTIDSTSSRFALYGSWTNNGTLLVQNGGTLLTGGGITDRGAIHAVSGVMHLNGTFSFPNPSTTLQAEGTIFLDGVFPLNNNMVVFSGAGSFFLNSCTFRGGTISETNGALLTTYINSTFDAITINGNIFADAELTVHNGLVLNGTLQVGVISPCYGAGTVHFDNTETISGSGQVFLGCSDGDRLDINGTNSTVTFGVTITGNHGIATTSNNANYVIQGTVLANGADSVIQLLGSWINRGTLIARNNSQLRLGGSWTNSAATTTLLADGGTILFWLGGFYNANKTTILDGNGGWVMYGLISGGTLSMTNALGQLTSVGGTLDNVTFANGTVYGADLTIQNGLELMNSTLSVGMVTLANSQMIDALDGSTGAVQFVVNGTVQGPANGTVTIGPNITVRGGQATVGGSQTHYINQGTAIAQSGTLTLAGTWTNQGTFRAIGGNVLNVQNTPTNYDGSALNGGSWQAASGGILRMPMGVGVITDNADIVLDGPDARFFRDNGSADALASFSAIGVNGSFTLTGGRNFTAPGIFTNNGTLSVDFLSTFNASAGLTNFSAGTLTGGTYNLRGTLQFPGANVQTNDATLVFDGVLAQVMDQNGGDGLANFAVNDYAGSFTVQNGRNFTSAGPFTNTGVLLVGPGSTFTAGGSYTQYDGQTILAGGTLASADPRTPLVDIEGGSLAGTGTVNAAVLNAGLVDVGGSGAAGQLTINGDYTQTAAGTLNIEIGGYNPGTDFDQLVVNGNANLDGTLTVSLINGFAPLSGDAFAFLTTSGSVNGVFANTVLDPAFGDPVYDPMDVTLVAR